MLKQIFIEKEPTFYWIDESGMLLNKKTNRYYKGTLRGGYLYYDLRWNNKKYSYTAHRLVALNFIPNTNNLPVVNHIDGNKQNNHYSNLEWVTYSENNRHAYNIGLKQKTNGIFSRKNYTGDLSNEIWKQYINTPYKISNKGRIWNTKTNRILKGKITANGYIEWCLSVNGVKKSFLAHRLIYKVFYEKEIPQNMVINHIDGNKTNNNLKNLECITSSENEFHSLYITNVKHLRKVEQYSMDNKLLNEYSSCAEAARKNIGCYSNLISKTCNGLQKSHYGFIWKYKK